LPVERVNKVAEGRPHIVDKIIDGEMTLIFNTTEGWQSLKDSQSIRGSALTGQGSVLYDRCRIGGCGRGDCCNAKYES
jgi:carbamoyl-phosphate synthase large subunit